MRVSGSMASRTAVRSSAVPFITLRRSVWRQLVDGIERALNAIIMSMFCCGVYLLDHFGQGHAADFPAASASASSTGFSAICSGCSCKLHPFRKPDAPHLFDIAGPRPESQPVQSVNDLLIGTKPLVEGTGRMAGPGKANRRNSDCGNRKYYALHLPCTSTEQNLLLTINA